MKKTNGYLCPVCFAKGGVEPLNRKEHTYVCEKGHSFDRAKSGYVNLLLPGEKHSKVPGDNQVMVAARQKFLNKGYYQPLADAVGNCLFQSLSVLPHQPPYTILDAGCGEGYYTNHMRNVLTHQNVSFRMFGIDISKIALDKAAKRDKITEYAVASIFHLPEDDASLDALTILFAPYSPEETQRVLKPDGLLLLVVPGERHLLELKNAVYDKPYVNEVKDEALDGFDLLDHRHLEYPMELSCNEDIENLFTMTPYYYKTTKENQQRLSALNFLRVTASFEILLYKRRGCGKE